MRKVGNLLLCSLSLFAFGSNAGLNAAPQKAPESEIRTLAVIIF
jgi:hypothetical protein